jgi:hypothetical protein
MGPRAQRQQDTARYSGQREPTQLIAQACNEELLKTRLAATERTVTPSWPATTTPPLVGSDLRFMDFRKSASVHYSESRLTNNLPSLKQCTIS